MPVITNIILELKFLFVENDFQKYSVAVCLGLSLILVMYNISLWAVVFTHYKHKNHPLVAERFGFVLNHIKDYGSAGKAEKP
jgi:hypothetical protein